VRMGEDGGEGGAEKKERLDKRAARGLGEVEWGARRRCLPFASAVPRR
jgi:hypothetical protein